MQSSGSNRVDFKSIRLILSRYIRNPFMHSLAVSSLPLTGDRRFSLTPPQPPKGMIIQSANFAKHGVGNWNV